MPEYAFETYGELEPWAQREWLATNGTGAFASSSVVGANTRRYHGLLVGATLPPVGRIVALSRINETVERPGRPAIELGVCYFRELILPRGDRHLQRFTHDITTRWEYAFEGVRITKEVLLCHGRNVVGIQYLIEPASEPVTLRLQPFVALRDFHHLSRADHTIETRRGYGSDTGGGCVVRRWGHELHMRCDNAAFDQRPGLVVWLYLPRRNAARAG